MWISFGGTAAGLGAPGIGAALGGMFAVPLGTAAGIGPAPGIALGARFGIIGGTAAGVGGIPTLLAGTGAWLVLPGSGAGLGVAPGVKIGHLFGIIAGTAAGVGGVPTFVIIDPILQNLHSGAMVIHKLLEGMPSLGDPWPIYISHMPDKPDEIITCYDTGGTPDGRIQRTGEHIRHPGWQVRVRGLTYLAGYQQAKIIQRFLEQAERQAVVIDGDTYTIHAITVRSDIIHLGQPDEKRREAFTINGTLTFTAE